VFMELLKTINTAVYVQCLISRLVHYSHYELVKQWICVWHRTTPSALIQWSDCGPACHLHSSKVNFCIFLHSSWLWSLLPGHWCAYVLLRITIQGASIVWELSPDLPE